ncbi:MAG: hypothetical protein ABIP94_00240, partial [Planctomycetota bacterium]
MPPATAPPTRPQHLQAVSLALLCAVLFLRDGLLPGRALVPHPPELFDVHRAEAQARGTFDPADAYRGNAGMADKYVQSLCWDRVMQDRFRAGELPRWTKDIGGGAPFVPQMAQPWQPINLLLLLVPGGQWSAEWYGWWFLIHQVLFGYFAYLFLRRLRCLHQSALLGLVVAALGLWTQCKLHHNVILTAALSLWPMLSSVHDLVASGVEGRAKRWAIGWLALWAGLSWASGFVVVSLQSTYLTVLFALLLAAQRARGERLRCLLPVGIGLALGAMLCLANMLPVLMAHAVSARPSFDAAWLAVHGLEWDHLLSLCWPDLLSWASDHFYPPAAVEPASAVLTRMPWSHLVLLEQPPNGESTTFQSWVETSFSIGIAPLGAALLALFGRQRRTLTAFFAIVAFVAFGIATADPPFLGLARLLPGLGAADLRRLLFSVAMALVVLSAMGADAVLRGPRRWPMVTLFCLVAVTSIAALLWLHNNGDENSFVRANAQLFVADADDPLVRQIGGNVDRVVESVRSAMKPGEAMYNHAMLTTTAWRTLLLALLATAALWLRASWRLPAWIALTMLELLHVGLGPVQTVPAGRVTTPPLVLQPVLAAAEPNGVRPRLQRLVVQGGERKNAALPGNWPGFLHIEDGSAYNPLPPARFEEFFRAIEPSRDGKPDVAYGGAGVGSFHDPVSLQHPLCDLFGLRFVLTREPVAANDTLVDRTPEGTGGFRLLERTTTLPRATFVSTVDVIPDLKARLAALSRGDRDVQHRV